MNNQPVGIPPHSVLDSLLNHVLPGRALNYGDTTDSRNQTTTPAPVAPKATPVATSTPSVKSNPVPKEWQPAIQSVQKMYPDLPLPLVKTTLMMESSMGTDTANQKTDFGKYGYLGGLTKTGHYNDTVQNYKKDPTLDYKPFKAGIPGMTNLNTPDAAIHATASVLQQLRLNNPGMSDQDLYFKLFNASSTSDTPDRRQQFDAHMKNYAQ
jgi:hypothetical protein